MTTAREVMKVYRPLLKRYPDLRAAGTRSLYLVPIRHLACRVLCERSPCGDTARVMWTVTALFLPGRRLGTGIGTYMQHLFRKPTTLDSSGPSWKWPDPTMIPEAIETIEAQALPKLRFYATPEGYATLPHRPHWVFDEPPEDRMLVDIAVGDLDAARGAWREREPLYRGKTYHPDSRLYLWQMQLAAVAEPLLSGDRPALARVLHGWEAANVRGTSIEPYWESTPFPLEGARSI